MRRGCEGSEDVQGGAHGCHCHCGRDLYVAADESGGNATHRNDSKPGVPLLSTALGTQYEKGGVTFYAVNESWTHAKMTAEGHVLAQTLRLQTNQALIQTGDQAHLATRAAGGENRV
jgi:hypothetical protein